MQTNAPLEPQTIVAFRRQLRGLEREIMRQLEVETGCCGVTLGQCHALLELAMAPSSLGALAATLDVDNSTMSRTVDGLVRAGLVERVEDPADRRSLRLSLTNSGREKVEFIDDSCNHYYGQLLAELSTKDRRCVLRAVGLLAQRMVAQRGTRSCCPNQERTNGNR